MPDSVFQVFLDTKIGEILPLSSTKVEVQDLIKLLNPIQLPKHIKFYSSSYYYFIATIANVYFLCAPLCEILTV